MFSRSTWSVLAIVVALLGVATAQECTPQTCPPGPVMLTFAYSNCSGPYTIVPVPIDVCLPGNFQYKMHGSDVKFVLYQGNNTNCAAGVPEPSWIQFIYTYGICDSSHRVYPQSSVMYLANVNDTFTSPQDYPLPSQNLPVRSLITVPCDNATDCAEHSPLHLAVYLGTPYTCNRNPNRYTMYNITAGDCYRNSDSNLTTLAECGSPSVSRSIHYHGDCATLLYKEESHFTCESSMFNLNCTGPIGVPTQPQSPMAQNPTSQNPMGQTPSGEPQNGSAAVASLSALLVILASLAILLF